MIWSIDRLGRSTAAVTTALAELDAAGVAIYADKEAMDATTAHGRAMLQMAAVFAELEHGMIRERVMAGLARVRDRLLRHAEIAGGEGEGFGGAQHELARSAVGQRVVQVIDDARLESADNRAHHPGTLAGQRAAQNEIRLGRAVAVNEFNTETLAELGMEALRHTRSKRNSHAVRTIELAGGRDSRIGTIAPRR